MSIDWSKAPEGTEAHHAQGEGYTDHWMRDGHFCVVGFEADGWVTDHCPSRHSALITKRPLTWTGEGLPPVGTLCEMSLFSSKKWELCTPVYYLNHPIDHSDQVVVYQNSLGGDVCYVLDPPCAGSIEFRPIRTPEQIAEEEREKAIREMGVIALSTDPLAVMEGVAALYDAGYRKQ